METTPMPVRGDVSTDGGDGQGPMGYDDPFADAEEWPGSLDEWLPVVDADDWPGQFGAARHGIP